MSETIIHQDATAGVSFPVPFDQPAIKTENQVTGLILEDVKAQIPEGARFTSGVYAKAGVPYILVWTREDKVAPSLADVDSLEKVMKFDRAELRGVLREPIPGKDGTKALLLTQIAKGETIQVGYFYKSQADAAHFQVVTEGFTLDSAKKLSPDALTSGPTNIALLAVGLLAFAIGFGAVLISRRVYLRKPPRRTSPVHGNA